MVRDGRLMVRPCPRQYLSKIKLLQLERDRGEWEGLAPDARREKESSLHMFGQLAGFHNIMSNETIGTLAFLTSGERCSCAVSLAVFHRCL